MAVPDTIERVVTMLAPRNRVWAALTQPEGLRHWLGQGATVDLRPGGEMVLDFGEYGLGRCRIVTVEPPRHFAFRWQAPGTNPEDPVEAGPSTLVDFRLEEVPGGTRLTLVESGFASLPADIAAQSHTDNTGGWEIELGELVEFVEAAPVTAGSA